MTLSAPTHPSNDVPPSARTPRPAKPTPSSVTAFGAFTDMTADHGFEPMRVEGTLPTELRGTLYRNGPGRFSSFGRRYGHWFDGDGALAAVRFDGGRAEGAARVTRTRGLLEEQRQGRALYAGFGTRSPRGILTRILTSDATGLNRLIDGKNTANTSVMWDGERLLALWEGGKPTAIDPRDLTTLGETDLGGAVAQTFSAHPHRVPSRKTTYNHGIRHGRKPLLDIYAKPDGGAWRLAGSLTLPWATMMHDIAITDRHVIVFVAPVRIRVLSLLLGLESAAESVRFEAERGMEVLVAPLDDLTKVTRLHTDARFLWHVANAYEGPDGPVVDVVLYDDFSNNDFLASVPSGQPRGELNGRLSRARIDLARRRMQFEELSATVGEFPIVAPRVVAAQHRYVYMAAHGSRAASGRDLHDRIVEIDVTNGTQRELALGDGLYPGEPIFVERSGDQARSGYLLTLVYDARAHTSHVAVLDAERLESGPVAKIHFDHHVPPGFHGTWAPAI